MIRSRLSMTLAAICAASCMTATPMMAQGPGSCGFHLDLVTNLTSTHSAVADMPGAPGGLFGYPFGAPGNPYQAYATPGTVVTFSLGVPAGTLGPAPIGPFSSVTILYSTAPANLAFFPFAPFVLPCPGNGGAIVLSILPFFGAPIEGTLIDGAGILAPPPLFPAVDPGFPAKYEISVLYPAAVPAIPITFQAVVVTPAGGVAISNAVCLLPGPNPAEISLLPALVACGAFPPTDGGQALAVPVPGLFLFYGVAPGVCDVGVNGFIDFVPGAATAGGCDFTGTFGDLGCAAPTPTARPRIDVNHGSIDFAVAPPAPLVNDLTFEVAPPGPTWPGRTLFRWKNAMGFGTVPGSANNRSATLELWYDSRIVVVRERAANSITPSMQEQIGIGPGIAGQGFGGPPPGACPVGPGVLLAPLWGTPGFTALPGDIIAMDSIPDSAALSNLAVVFTPDFGAPVAYTVTVY